jgi:pyruvate-formate lyase-activating enzyme
MDEQSIDQLSNYLQRKHKVFHYARTSMGLILTDKCPVGCLHCISDNSLYKGKEIDLSFLKSRVDKTVELGSFDKIVITGGEPFFEFDKLRDLIIYITSKNLNASTVTSAYWAKSIKISREKLTELKTAGLQSLAISMDIYHQEKVPYQNIINVLEICAVLRIPNTVVYTYSKDRLKDGHLLKQLFESLPEPLRKSLRITEGSMLQSGRAQMNNLGPFNPEEKDNQPLICQSMGKIIRSDGQLALCCGADLPDNSTLLAGNIDSLPIPTLKDNLETNHFIPFIEIFGLKWMMETLKKSFSGYDFSVSELHTDNRCNICQKMLGNKDYRNYFKNKIKEEAIQNELKGKYLLYYGHSYPPKIASY